MIYYPQEEYEVDYQYGVYNYEGDNGIPFENPKFINPPPEHIPINIQSLQISINPTSPVDSQMGFSQYPDSLSQQKNISDSIHEHNLNYAQNLSISCTICQQNIGGQTGYKC